jgi:polyhydroxybutyrate depolymerase
MTRIALGLALLGALVLGVPAAAEESRRMMVDGVDRHYLLHVPRGAGPFPLVLAFHGRMGRGRGMIGLTGLSAIADEEGVVVAYPDGIDRHWNDGRLPAGGSLVDVDFARSLIDRLAAELPIDRSRVYAAGISNGAMLRQRLACLLSDRLAAVASVAGTMPGDVAPDCHPAIPVAVMLVEGTGDPLVPYGGGLLEQWGPFGGGKVLSAVASFDLWRRIDRCGAGGQAPPSPDGVDRRRAESCATGSAVELVSLTPGGHTWPGGPQYLPAAIIGPVNREFAASREILAFFLAHPKRP